MKKYIFSLFLILTLALATKAQGFLSLTPFQRNGTAMTDTVQSFNVSSINLITPGTNSSTIQFVDFLLKSTQNFKVRQVADSVALPGNRKGLNFIKLRKAQQVGLVDSFFTYWYNLNSIDRVVDATSSSHHYQKSNLYYKDYNGTTVIPLADNAARYQTMYDSIRNVVKGAGIVSNVYLRHGLHDTLFYKVDNTLANDTIKR